MNRTQLGITVSILRKQHNLTQAALAEKLGVTSKAVSKWETGSGYPEVTLLPKLAAILDVTIDYLLCGEHQV